MRELFIEEKARELAEEFKYYRSLDSYLVKLTSLAYDVEDFEFGNIEGAKALFEAVLRHSKLSNYMSSLSCYKDSIEAKIMSDPRLKKLREYRDVLMSILSESTCREVVPIESISREATFRIEKVEEAKEAVKERPTTYVTEVKRPWLSKIFIWAGVAVLILVLIYALLRFVR
jgi:hypothetical protein